MTGQPTFVVKLDDGTGTFPYDITTYVDAASGWSITRGRADEHGSVSPSVLSLTLDNMDGRFTFGSTSGGYGAINSDRPIRFSETVGATTYTRFTGYVQEWPVEWPGGVQGYAVARITAVDRLARMSRRKFRPVAEEEILVDGPVALYTLSEPEGSTSAGDSSGRGQPFLISERGAFGEALSDGVIAEDGLTGVLLDPDGASLVAHSLIIGAPAVIWIEFTFRLDDNGPMVTLSNGATAVAQISKTAFNLTATVTGGGVTLNLTGSPPTTYLHHAALKLTHGVGATLYLDSVLTATGSNAAFSTAGFDGMTLLLTTGTAIVGTGSATLARVAIGGTDIDPARFASRLSLFDSESPSARVTRYTGYANVAPVDLDLSTAVLDKLTADQGLAGKSPTSSMETVATTEGGLTFIDGAGKVVFQNRDHRRTQAAAVVTFVADDLGPDVRPVSDMQQVRNDVTGSRPDGAEQRASNQASIDAHEEYGDSIELLVLTDEHVKDRIDWIVGVYAEPQPRLPNLTVDLLTQTQAKQQAVLALEISDRVDLSGMPSQAPSQASHLVEGWTEQGSSTSWSITFNASPFDFEAAWILEDAALGVLDDTTRLGY